jgi:carbon storage regulator
MLIVRRRVGERIVIRDGIEITVTGVSGRSVRLGVAAPRGVSVLRGEVHDEVVQANAAAAASAAADAPVDSQAIEAFELEVAKATPAV